MDWRTVQGIFLSLIWWMLEWTQATIWNKMLEEWTEWRLRLFISTLAINNVPFLKPRDWWVTMWEESWGRWQTPFESVPTVWVSEAQLPQRMLDFSSFIRYARMSKPSPRGPQPCQVLCPIRQNIAFAKETWIPAESLISLVGLKPVWIVLGDWV